MPSKPRGSSKGMPVLVALQVVAVMIPLVATRMHVRADMTFLNPGGGGSGDMSMPSTTDGGGATGGRTTGGAHLNPKVDNTRNQWEWSPSQGWVLKTQSQTYQNGWSWTWKENAGWTWQQTVTPSTTSPELKTEEPTAGTATHAAATIQNKAEDAVSAPVTQGCLTGDGSWTENRNACSVTPITIETDDLRVDVPAAPDRKVVPDVIRSALEEARDLTPDEEREVQVILQDRFTGTEAVQTVEPVVSRTASDLIRKLSILKDNAQTSEARDYLVSRIAAAQELSAHLSDAETKADVDAVTNELRGIATDVQIYVAENGVTVHADPAAPTGMDLVNMSADFLKHFPKVFALLADRKLTTDTLRDRYDTALKTLDAVRTRCETQNRCGEIRDVIEQIEQLVLSIKTLASGDNHLSYDIDQSFTSAR